MITLQRKLSIIACTLLIFLVSPLLCQLEKTYKSVDEIKDEWENFTSFQKEELMGFCDYLYNNELYERALLAYFKFTFLHPQDELLSIVYYKIARCYEEIKNYELATEYYQRVMTESEINYSEYVAGNYRLLYLELIKKNYDMVIRKTNESKDPYMLVFRGYAFFSQLKWGEAKEAFRLAMSKFDNDRHQDDIISLIDACENVASLKLKNVTFTSLSSIIPGGGRVYLEDWIPVIGVIVTSTGLAIQTQSLPTTVVPKIVTVSAFASSYVMSFIGAYSDVDYINTQIVLKYADDIKLQLNPSVFLTFDEPQFLLLD